MPGKLVAMDSGELEDTRLMVVSIKTIPREYRMSGRNTVAKSDCGRAGQPGYVFRKGDSVIVTPAKNQPQGGWFVAKQSTPEDSIYLNDSEIDEFVE